MARLLDAPFLPIKAMEPLSGPETIGSSVSSSVGRFTQTVATFSALWRWQFSMAPMRDRAARDYRGWITALHGGANATRIHFFDPDQMTYAEAGVVASDAEIMAGIPWEGGVPWAGGQNWALDRPPVAVAGATARDETTIYLADEFWGHAAQVGDMLGFYPSNFGLYEITEVFEPGTYRIWPPLRRAITAEDFATLKPTLVMRLEGSENANLPRGLEVLEDATITLIEVPDYDVRQYFSG